MVGVAEHGPDPFRALEVELHVVLLGVANSAVELHAVDANPGERLGEVRFRERGVARELVAIDPADRRSEAFAKVAQEYLAGSQDFQRTGRRRAVPLDAWINILPLIGD